MNSRLFTELFDMLLEAAFMAVFVALTVIVAFWFGA